MKYEIPLGKYKGKDYYEKLKDKEALEYFHWLRVQPWFEEKFNEFFQVLKENLPDIEVQEVYIREVSEEEIEKFKEFNKDNMKNILKFYVTRIWGNRSLSTKHWKWLKLRNDVIERDKGKCRFCGSRFKKYLYIDHLDGDASNNELENLGINCRGCDAIRHCGRSGADGELILRISTMEQVEIVKKSYEYYLANKKNPCLEEIDPTCKTINSFVIKDISQNIIDTIDNPKGVEIPSTFIANVLLHYNYEELDDSIYQLKGFFSQSYDFSFLDHILI